MTSTAVNSPGLHRFALITAFATLGLVCIGGLVTSHGVGMAVPDWPNTYGYNMFFFPVTQWVGGVFYEHTHRLVASGVGLLTTILALWLYGKTARPLMRWTGVALDVLGLGIWLALPARWSDAVVFLATGLAFLVASFLWPRCGPSPKWLRRLGLIAFFAVVLQGVLGGLRVTEHKDEVGIFHATLAQLFFVLVCAIALFTSRWWQTSHLKSESRSPKKASSFHAALLVATILIFLQLVLGATMRHQHAGLAIPDFPLAYGKIWPAVDAASVEHYNQHRLEVVSLNPITGAQIVLQMVHRVMAVLIFVAVGLCTWIALRLPSEENFYRKGTVVWLALISTQVFLGAATIWSDKAADIATAHVLIGVLSLAAGTILCIVSFQHLAFANRKLELAAVSEALPPMPSRT